MVNLVESITTEEYNLEIGKTTRKQISINRLHNEEYEDIIEYLRITCVSIYFYLYIERKRDNIPKSNLSLNRHFVYGLIAILSL